MTQQNEPNKLVDGNAFVVRTYMAGDEAKLAQLYCSVYGRERSIEQWRWKMLGRGGSMVGVWLAEERGSGRIVAQYCGIPVEMMLDGQVCGAVEAVEAMTAPDFRRRGLLTALVTSAHESWRQDGRRVVIGLPNQQWGTRTRALGWRQLFPLAWLRFPLRLDRVVGATGGRISSLSGALRPPALLASAAWRGLHVARRRGTQCEIIDLAAGYLPAVAEQIDELWLHAGKSYPNTFIRDSNWLKWRFAPESGYDYRVIAARRGSKAAGYLAYRLADTGGRVTGYLADIFALRNDFATVRTMVASALQALDKAGASTVVTAAPKGSSLYRVLRGTGFLPRRAAFSVEAVLLDDTIDFSQLANPGSWHLTAGDFDVI
jgi:hypothetical protein